MAPMAMHDLVFCMALLPSKSGQNFRLHLSTAGIEMNACMFLEVTACLGKPRHIINDTVWEARAGSHNQDRITVDVASHS